MLKTLFNFQNFGNKQPKKIQLCMLTIPQKIRYWGFMKQTKLNLLTIWQIARKTYGKLEELTLMVILIWPILRVRSFWRQHLHLQTPWKLTKVRKYYLQLNLAIRNFLVALKLFLNTKSSLSLWSKWQIGHRKWFLNTNSFLIKPFLIAKFDCIKNSLILTANILSTVKTCTLRKIDVATNSLDILLLSPALIH